MSFQLDLSEDQLEDYLSVATDEEAEWLRHLLATEVALNSPLDYACYVSPETVRYPHVELLSEHIEALCEHRLYYDGPGPPARWFYELEDGIHECKSIDDIPFDGEWAILEFWGEHPYRPGDKVLSRLAVTMPPRHGKSWITTLHTPGWYLSRWPDRKVAVTTYSDDFSWEWGEQVNRQLDENNEFVKIKGNRQLIRELKHGGEIRFAGVGGRLTGTGYHLGLIDDPFKNSEEAMSQANRDSKDNWYGSVFLTRKEPRAVEIMMYTRWHEDDLSGRRVFEPESTLVREDWCLLHLPAIALSPDEYPSDEWVDPVGREEGEALCPARKTLAELEKARKDDPLWFDALYQGSPTIEAGGVTSPPYHHWRDANSHVELMMAEGENLLIPKKNRERFGILDLAASKEDWADYSVFGVFDWFRDQQKLLLVHAERERVESALHEDWAVNIAHEWDVETLGIEERTFGLTLIQLLNRRGGFNVFPLYADKDKIARAIPYGQAITKGNVFFPQGAPFLHVWELEHRNFPNAKFDDQVDVGGYAWMFTRLMPAYVSKRQKPKTDAERCMDQALKGLKKKGRWGKLAHMLRQ